MTRRAEDIGRGLAPSRDPRAIGHGERIHVVGAAGAGASAAALLAHEAGADVSGCDPGTPSPYTEALTRRGIEVAGRHDAAHVATVPPPDRLAVTKALTSVHPGHPELAAARAAGVPIEAWQQTVADAAHAHGGRLVAVAGTHGKSTSAGWLVHLLVQAGRDPGAFVGALLPAGLSGGTPATARWGRGDAFVLEADEYAGNFDPYRPSLAVILNAEWDHPDVFADRAAVVDTFERWLRAPGSERREVVVNVADDGARELANRLSDWGDRVIAVEPRSEALPPLLLAGRHNAANAACVAAAAARLGLTPAEIDAGLRSFSGVGRRFDIRGEPGGVLIIDDYGHHPTAIRATIDAVRERYPGRRLWVAHEPLTYHRAAAMLEPFAAALATADEVVIAEIWAGRDPDTTVTSASALADAVAALTGRDVAAPGDPEATAEYLAEQVQPGDVVLAMGGGRSYVIAERLLHSREARGSK